MKVSIPVMNRDGMSATVGAHFGKVPYYAIIDTENGDLKFIDNTSEHTGGKGLPPELLAKAGIHIMLCGGLGPKAVDLLCSFGVQVYVGAGGTVQETMEAWQQGKLSPANHANACSEHSH
jgi:predicted Fe-Mo cluster-binding NifX family protein